MPMVWIEEYKVNISNFCLSSQKITHRQRKASVTLGSRSLAGKLTCSHLIHTTQLGTNHSQYVVRNLEFISKCKEPRETQARGRKCCTCCVSMASREGVPSALRGRKMALAAGGPRAQRGWPGWGHQLSWWRAAHAGGAGPGQKTSRSAGKLCGKSAQGSDFRLPCCVWMPVIILSSIWKQMLYYCVLSTLNWTEMQNSWENGWQIAMPMRNTNLNGHITINTLVALWWLCIFPARCLCVSFLQLRNAELFVSPYFPVVYFTLF